MSVHEESRPLFETPRRNEVLCQYMHAVRPSSYLPASTETALVAAGYGPRSSRTGIRATVADIAKASE